MKRGFTVIELIVTIAIVAILIVLIIGAIIKESPKAPHGAVNCTWVESKWAVCSIKRVPHLCTEKGCSPLVIPPAEKGN